MPLASIIIPTYNQARYLGATLDSALSQSIPSLEVIVMDDGSTDDTRILLEPYLDRIQYIYQENRGLAAARNRGFYASSGAYVLFLDSDDLIPPDKLARQIDVLEKNPEMGLCYSAWEHIDPQGRSLSHEVHPVYQGDVLIPLLLRRFFFFAGAAVIRRTVLEAHGLFDESLRWGEDADLWLRLALRGCRFGCLPEVLLKYRVHPQSMTATAGQEQVNGWLSVLDKFFSTPALSTELLALRGEAYSVLHFETAGRYFRSGHIQAAQQQLTLGTAVLDRPVDADWFMEWLAGTALDARTEDPLTFLSLVMDHLPVALASFQKFRRRAFGRYFTAAAFLYAQQGDTRRCRGVLIPAVWYDPSVLRNRGFLRLIMGAVKGRGKRQDV